MQFPTHIFPVSGLVDVVRAEKELFEIFGLSVRTELLQHLVEFQSIVVVPLLFSDQKLLLFNNAHVGLHVLIVVVHDPEHPPYAFILLVIHFLLVFLHLF